MNIGEIKSQLEHKFPGVALKLVRDSLLVEKPGDLTKVALLLKENMYLDYLSSVTGADYLNYLESVYHFYSIEKKTGPIVLRVRVSREKPAIPSLVPVYRGAEFQEREAYDMYGIHYEGHPDLRRIFMWEGYEGYPMRKDYQQEDSETLETADIEWLDKHGIHVPDEMRKKAEEFQRQGKRAVAQKPGEAEPA